LPWPGLDPAKLGYLTLVQAFVSGYMAVTNPQVADRYVQTFCAMVGMA
jgi:hypothetical protein